MNALFNIAFSTIIVTVVMFITPTSAGSCFGLCKSMPTLLDYMHPVGCYCHATCGRKLPCCFDKEQQCDNSCQTPKKVRGVSLVGIDSYTYTKGQSIKYECDYHYEISGSDTRTCLGNNRWTPGHPTCKYVRFVCRPPTISDGNYEIQKKQYRVGESVTITCERGYILDGVSKITCGIYRWNGRIPSCIEDRCSRTSSCSPDATCKNTRSRAVCSCNEGFSGSGSICTRIPCYKHTCTSEEVCVDRGDNTGDYDCECKEGYVRDESSCIVDPCANNDCHKNASCSVVDGASVCSCNEGYKGNGTMCEVDPCFENNCHEHATCGASGKGGISCFCDEGYKGNGTHCEVAKCDPGELYGEEESIVGMCNDCEDTCCEEKKLRECRICIHMKCNGGEVCGEEGLSRVPTVCVDKKCYENRDRGFTVTAPSWVHCLDERGSQKEGFNCCWVGE
ncbi:uncharacterized protein LOC120337636 [Styela clava]